MNEFGIQAAKLMSYFFLGRSFAEFVCGGSNNEGAKYLICGCLLFILSKLSRAVDLLTEILKQISSTP